MSKFCPFCGEELVDSAKFCKNCGKNVEIASPNQSQKQYDVPVVEKEHTAAIVIGYILAILIPLFGVFVSVYLLTRNDSERAKSMGNMFSLLQLSFGSCHF